jgi:hypothetical protein
LPALETVGRKERFHWLASGGGEAEAFIFAAPDPFLPIAVKYGSPLR